MKIQFLACTGAMLALASFSSNAVDNGIYLGASIGQSGVDIDEAGFDGGDFSSDATGFKVIAGWRFLDWLSIEGNYVDLGSGDDTVDGDRLEVDASGLSLSAVASCRSDQWTSSPASERSTGTPTLKSRISARSVTTAPT